MPELAEVEYYRKQWNPGLGKRILAVETHPAARIYREIPAAAVVKGLSQRHFLSSYSHGKQMLFEFSDGAWLGLHLGMTGELRSESIEHTTTKHEHLVLRTDSTVLVFSDYRMFGKLTLDLCEDGLAPPWWRALPPQVLDSRFTKQWLYDFVRRFPRTPVKTLLLDQRGFPGIGNWMADEICWQLRLNPSRLAGTLEESLLADLWKVTRKIARDSLRIVGTDWGELPDSWLMNYRWKKGQHCPRSNCRSELVRGDLRGRTTCWCPNCQSDSFA